MTRHHVVLHTLDTGMVVHTGGGPVKVDGLVRRYPVEFARVRFLTRLLVLPLRRYDLVFMMNWLTATQSRFLCQERQIVFTVLGGPETTFDCIDFLSLEPFEQPLFGALDATD